MQALVVNPRRRRRRKKSRGSSRRHYPKIHRRRRRRNPTLQIMNPRSGGIMKLLITGATVAAGAVASKWIPRKIFKDFDTKSPMQQAAFQVGTGIGLVMIGGKFLGRATAENLAVGATAAATLAMLEKYKPGLTGLGGFGMAAIPITEAEIDNEIRSYANADMQGLGDEFDVETLPYPGE